MTSIMKSAEKPPGNRAESVHARPDRTGLKLLQRRDILDLNIDGIALATVADSFAAIEQRVVEEKKLTWDRLFELLDTNYEGAERERLMLKNIRRFSRLPRLRTGQYASGTIM